MNRAYLLLGSNIAPERNLPAAVREATRFGRIVRASNVWETPPVGDLEQPNFLNAAVLLETPLSAREICLEAIPAIEHALRRVRDPSNRNAPRPIDVDLSLFNRDIVAISHRQIPAPDVLTRAFVAVPLAELDPEYVHPATGQTLATIAADFETERAAMTLRADVVLL